MPQKLDLTGRKFGLLTVIKEAGRDKTGNVMWLCACQCGTKTVKRGTAIKRGKGVSCGCAQREKSDLTGQRFGRLTVISRAGRNAHGRAIWRCLCDCGTETVKQDSVLKRNVRSCGCIGSPVHKTHGQSKSPLYIRWSGMIQRTTNPHNKEYANYGGRGITVCPEWRKSFEAFARDVGSGFSPELELDRIDNDCGYEPGNVRWATRAEQGRNRRTNRLVTWRGREMSAVEWSKLLGIIPGTLRRRLDDGWPVERALTTGADPQSLACLTASTESADHRCVICA